MRTLSTQLGFLILGGAALVAAGSCARRSGPTIELPPHLEASEPDHFRAVRPMMGTFIDIEVPSKRSPELTAAAEAAFAAAARVDQEMNEWRPESQLSKVNAAAGIAPVKVDEDLFGLLETARRYGELTGGAFDVTWAAMRGVW